MILEPICSCPVHGRQNTRRICKAADATIIESAHLGEKYSPQKSSSFDRSLTRRRLWFSLICVVLLLPSFELLIVFGSASHCLVYCFRHGIAHIKASDFRRRELQSSQPNPHPNTEHTIDQLAMNFQGFLDNRKLSKEETDTLCDDERKLGTCRTWASQIKADKSCDKLSQESKRDFTSLATIVNQFFVVPFGEASGYLFESVIREDELERLSTAQDVIRLCAGFQRTLFSTLDLPPLVLSDIPAITYDRAAHKQLTEWVKRMNTIRTELQSSCAYLSMYSQAPGEDGTSVARRTATADALRILSNELANNAVLLALSIGGDVLETLNGFERYVKTEEGPSAEARDENGWSDEGSHYEIKSEQFSGESTADTMKLEEDA